MEAQLSFVAALTLAAVRPPLHNLEAQRLQMTTFSLETMQGRTTKPVAAVKLSRAQEEFDSARCSLHQLAVLLGWAAAMSKKRLRSGTLAATRWQTHGTALGKVVSSEMGQCQT